MRPSWTRAWAATHGAWAASAVGKRLPLELLGLAQIAARERVRPEPGEGERRVVAEPDAPRELERAPVRLHRGGAVLPALRHPRLEQQPRDAERVVVDRVRVTADRRRHGGDGGDVAGAGRAYRADEAARRGAPVVAGRLERRGRFSRQRVGLSLVAGLRQGERERQSREPQLPGRRRARGERERAFARRERGLEIELLGREVAEDGEQLDPQLDRGVVARGRQRQLE